MSNEKTENLQKQDLDLDTLEMVTGGASNRTSTLVEGTVVAVLENCKFSVDIDGQLVTAIMSSKLRMNFIRIFPGDRVQVELESNRIMYRYRRS